MRFTSFSELHFEQWEPMWLDYAGDRRAELSKDLNEKTFARLRTPSSVLQGLAVWADGPVGFAHFFMHPSTWSETEECYLQDLYVSRTKRGAGLGKQLVLEVAKIAQVQGCTVLHWRTRASNLGAQAMYEKIARRLDYVEFEMNLE